MVPELKQGRSPGEPWAENVRLVFLIDVPSAHTACRGFNSGTVSTQRHAFVFHILLVHENPVKQVNVLIGEKWLYTKLFIHKLYIYILQFWVNYVMYR